MKRFIIAIILFATTVSCCVAENIWLDNSVKLFTADINSVMQNVSDENSDKAQNLATDVVDRWQEQQIFLSTFINHEHLDKITQAMISMRTNLSQGQIEDFFVDAELTKSLFEYLRSNDIPTPQNIL